MVDNAQFESLTVTKLKSLVTVLDQGSMLCEGEMAAVQADPRVIEVYLGR